MIIGISGKIGSGKDTIGNIIQYLTAACSTGKTIRTYEEFISNRNKDEAFHWYNSDWEIKKFADKLKDCTCLILGCTRAQLEDQEFKNKPLGEEWDKFHIQQKFLGTRQEWNDIIEKYHKAGLKIFIQGHESRIDETRYNFYYIEEKVKLTPRKILQLLGTECGRDIIHPNIWVNATFANYMCDDLHTPRRRESPDMNWIITDVRFPNEAEAIKKYHGILIRVNRDGYINGHEHASETSLDKYQKFDYVINNNGTIEALIDNVKQILIKEGIINGTNKTH